MWFDGRAKHACLGNGLDIGAAVQARLLATRKYVRLPLSSITKKKESVSTHGPLYDGRASVKERPSTTVGGNPKYEPFAPTHRVSLRAQRDDRNAMAHSDGA